MKLVVGLGNPGKKYLGTRHNLGFELLSILAQRHGNPSTRIKFESEFAEIRVGEERLMLAAPQTFMNLSGRAVRQFVNFYKIPLNELLVVLDDLNLEPGQVRLRGSGTAGGQKGLQNIIDQLGTKEFARLRIGIGRPPERIDASQYVLQRFSKSERSVIDMALSRAADAVELWAVNGLEEAMNRVNGQERGNQVE